MNYRVYYIWLSLFCCASCMPEENLPMRDMGETPGYFVECYCKPGEIFALTAMNIIPISEELKMEFTRDMDIRIRAKENIRLYYTQFTLPGSSFVYNYGSNKYLKTDIDTLFLDIVTADNKTITAQTAIPDEILIDSHELSADHLNVYFYTSGKSSQNYYILTASLSINGSVIEQKAYFLDYSKYRGGWLVEKSINMDDPEQADQIVLSLKRITKENYDYQISLNGANSANQSSITTPVPLKGNLNGALGIFTCYTEDNRTIRL